MLYIFKSRFDKECCTVYYERNTIINEDEELFENLIEILNSYDFAINLDNNTDSTVLENKINNLPENQYTCMFEYVDCLNNEGNLEFKKRSFGFVILMEKLISNYNLILNENIQENDDKETVTRIKNNILHVKKLIAPVLNRQKLTSETLKEINYNLINFIEKVKIVFFSFYV